MYGKQPYGGNNIVLQNIMYLPEALFFNLLTKLSCSSIDENK